MTIKPDAPFRTNATVDDRPDMRELQAEREPVSEASHGEAGILAALRRSPLVGADLDLARLREAAREIAL